MYCFRPSLASAVVFRRPNDTDAKRLQQHVARLEEKNEVLGKLLEKYVAPEKDLGHS